MKRVLRKSICLLLLMALLLPMALNGSMTAKAEESGSGNTVPLAGRSATLTDDIAVKFYFSIADEDVENTTLNITVDGESYPAIAAKNADVKNGYRVFTVNIAAAQMTDNIHLELMKGEEKVHTGDYTFRQYAQKILDDSEGKYDDGTKELVKKTLNYGAASQIYFNHNAGNLANAGIEDDENTYKNPAGSNEIITENSVDGISLYGMTLMFRSKTAVRFYFTVTGNVGDYTFKVGEKDYEPQPKGSKYYYVEVDGITPDKLDELVELTVTDKSDNTKTMTVKYSPLTYMVRQYANSPDAKLKEAVKAMFNYCLEANTYLPATPAKPADTAAMKNSDGFLTFADLPANPLDPAEIEDYKALGFTTALLTEDYSRALAYTATVDEGLDTVTRQEGQQELKLTFTGYTGEGTMLQIKTNLPTDGSYGDFLMTNIPEGAIFDVKSARPIGWMTYAYDTDSKAVYLNPNFSESFMDGEKFIIKAGTKFPANGTEYVLCHDYIVTMHNEYLASIDNLYNAGLNVWIRNYNNKPEYFTENLTKALLNYKDKISGFYIADEAHDTDERMNAVNQGNITTSFDAIAATEISWFKTNFPNAYFHTNQVPYTSYDHYGDGKEPADYAVAYNNFLNNYSTKILSNLGTTGKSMCYDNYPFIKKTSGVITKRDILFEGYLFNMLLAANAAKNAPAGTDFGVCIQTFTGTGMRDIIASSEVTFQLYTAMALGADMFEYFGYSSNSGMNGIILDGNKRETTNGDLLYDLVKSANNEALPFGEIIRTYDWQGIQLSKGKSHDNVNAFKMINDASTTLGKVTLTDDKYNGLLSAVSTSRDAVIGYFTKDGKDGYMVVNYNDPVKKKYDNEVTLTFGDCEKATVYTSVDGAIQSKYVDLVNGQYTATIAPGKAFFIVPDAYIRLTVAQGDANTITFTTNLPAGTTLKDFTAVDNDCNIDQSANDGDHQVGWIGMDKADETITLAFHFNKAFEAGQTYILKSGSVFKFTDGNTYILDKNYIFTWNGENWTVTNPISFEYRYGESNLIQFNTNLPSDTPCVNFTADQNGCSIDQSANEYQQVGWIGMDDVKGTIVLTFHFNSAFEAGQTYILKKGSVFGFTDGTSYILDKDYVFTWNGSTWTVTNPISFVKYSYGADQVIQLHTNLPFNTPLASFTAVDNDCDIDQSANKYQQFGWVGMDNVGGTIVLTFHFNSAFEAGQTYILKKGSVFGFTDGKTYTLDKDYVFTWDGSNWTVSNEIPVTLTYRYGANNLIQVNTDLPATTPCENFTAGQNGCSIDQSANEYQQVGWIGMDNVNGTIVLTFHFNKEFEAGQTYILKSGSVFGFTDGTSYTLDKDYVFTWDGSNWTMSNELPAEPIALEFAYRYGANNLIQVNTNLPATTPCENFTAGQNGCSIDQSANEYQQVGWIGMDNVNGTIVLTFHFNSAFANGQTYILKSGSVFGFKDGNSYTLDKDYIFTWDGSTWTVSNEIPATLNLEYRYGANNLIQVNTNLPATTPCENFTAGQNGCSIDQSANEYQQVGWIGMDNVNGTIVLTFHFNSAFANGQTYILKSGSVFGFKDGKTYTLDKDYVFTWNGSIWTLS